MLVLLLIQAAAAQPAPDISLHATVEAREVRLEKKGRAEIRAWGEPDGGSLAQSSGTRATRRFELKIDARIADALAIGTIANEGATSEAQRR